MTTHHTGFSLTLRLALALALALVVAASGALAGCAADVDDLTGDDEISGAEEEVGESTSAVSSVKECEFRYGDGSVKDWYPKGGGYAVYNVTSRITRCSVANTMAKSYYNSTLRRGAFDDRGYKCTKTITHPFGPGTDPETDMRCTKGDRVVRFQVSA